MRRVDLVFSSDREYYYVALDKTPEYWLGTKRYFERPQSSSFTDYLMFRDLGTGKVYWREVKPWSLHFISIGRIRLVRASSQMVHDYVKAIKLRQ